MSLGDEDVEQQREPMPRRIWIAAGLAWFGVLLLSISGSQSPLWAAFSVPEAVRLEFNLFAIVFTPAFAGLLLVLAVALYGVRRLASRRVTQRFLIGVSTALVIAVGLSLGVGGLFFVAAPAVATGMYAAFTTRPTLGRIIGVALLAMGASVALFVLGHVLVGGETD